MSETIRKAGEVWRIRDCRKGDMTIRLTEDVTEGQEWFAAELVEGKPAYLSQEVRIGAFSMPKPTIGDVMSFRQCLVTWLGADAKGVSAPVNPPNGAGAGE